MMHVVAKLFCVVLIAGLPGAARGLVTSGELLTTFDGSGVPQSSTADLIPFHVNTAGTIVIDSLSWEVDPNTQGDVDVNGDGETAYTDIDLKVYAANAPGVEIAASEDDLALLGTADGSLDTFDAYISQFLPVGNYLLSVHTAGISAGDDLDGEVTTGLVATFGPALIDHTHGDYQITFSGDVALPEPSALGWGVVALAGLGHRRRKLRDRRGLRTS